MRSYPIWNLITACIYQSGKSYGVKDQGDVKVLVGSSARNSHEFLTHSTTHRFLPNGDREFRFYVDGKCIKRRLLPKGASKLKRLNPKKI